jgi:hypothetical protein
MPGPVTNFRTVSGFRKRHLKLCQGARWSNSGALLVSRGCGFVVPIAYGIDESGAERRIVTGA